MVGGAARRCRRAGHHVLYSAHLCHLILPRPQHAKKRAERRRTIRRSRKEQQRNPVAGVGVELKQPYTQYSEFH